MLWRKLCLIQSAVSILISPSSVWFPSTYCACYLPLSTQKTIKNKYGDKIGWRQERTEVWLTWLPSMWNTAVCKVWRQVRCRTLPHFLWMLMVNNAVTKLLFLYPLTRLSKCSFWANTHLADVSSLGEALQALLLHPGIHYHSTHGFFRGNFCQHLRCH